MKSSHQARSFALVAVNWDDLVEGTDYHLALRVDMKLGENNVSY
jgi:hypothetical protein